MKKQVFLLSALSLFILPSCTSRKNGNSSQGSDSIQTSTQTLNLPKPYDTKSAVKFAKVIGWENGAKPAAPAGFEVTLFADSLRSARWIYVMPNGDILVSQANTEPKGTKKVIEDVAGASKARHNTGSPNQLTLFRDANKDGVPELREVFLEDLNQPFGMLVIGNSFYVATTDGIWKYNYKTGDTRITGEGKKISELPAGGYNNHWTRNIITNADHSKIYVSVGSASNVGEHGMEQEIRRACILEMNPDGSGERIYASGLRNPVGMAWAPGSKVLWTAVNERDKLGDELVPDYITSVKDGGFYGWPFSYFGQHPDPRFSEKEQRPDLVKTALVPDVPLGSHTASLGLCFYDKTSFPAKYRNGAFIGQHGSWNSSNLVGYKVVFVPFANGKPTGPPEDFLTGFIANADKAEVYGRPVGVTVLPDGSMLVADDASDKIWRISYQK